MLIGHFDTQYAYTFSRDTRILFFEVAKMRVGVPTEIKIAERRVGLTPTSVRELTMRGHRVLVQSGAGNGIGASDADYSAAGARVVSDAKAVFAQSELIVKVQRTPGCRTSRVGSRSCPVHVPPSRPGHSTNRRTPSRRRNLYRL